MRLLPLLLLASLLAGCGGPLPGMGPHDIGWGAPGYNLVGVCDTPEAKAKTRGNCEVCYDPKTKGNRGVSKCRY